MRLTRENRFLRFYPPDASQTPDRKCSFGTVPDPHQPSPTVRSPADWAQIL